MGGMQRNVPSSSALTVQTFGCQIPRMAVVWILMTSLVVLVRITSILGALRLAVSKRAFETYVPRILADVPCITIVSRILARSALHVSGDHNLDPHHWGTQSATDQLS